jgi:2-hydroxy-3-keto-5-methylthiopentenyl-1-phosphate phosphatase
MKLRIYTDFDGTITLQDSLNFLLDHYVGPDWLEIEKRVEAGHLTEERGLQDEIGMISAPWEEALQLLLEKVPVDSGFKPFVELCRDQGWPLEILSGGLDPIIKNILRREQIERVKVHANDLEFAALRWRVSPALSPRIKERCNHCKSNWLVDAKKRGERVIYIGDGTTDRCPAGHADLVFAKGALADWCSGEGISHIRFEGFSEIQNWFESSEGIAWIEQEVSQPG